MILTKREKIFLSICTIIVTVFIFIPQETLKEWESTYIICVGIPLGLYVVTDKERINKKGE